MRADGIEINGRRVTLRAPAARDFDVLMRIRNDEGLQRQLMAVDPKPNDALRVREWLERRACEDDTLFFVIADNLSGACAGFVQLMHIDVNTGTGELGICVEPSFQGRGMGGEAIELLEHHAREVFGVRRVALEVLASNAKALELYARIGFKQVGGSSDAVRLEKKSA